MAVIEAHEATIQTATVAIRTLTVSGKQVTLALFRQLKEERFEDDDGHLLGELWGTVNYHPDKCADSRPHVHVVWQLDTELRRAAVRPASEPGTLEGHPYSPKQRMRWVDSSGTWLAAALLAGRRPNKGTIIHDGSEKLLPVRFSHLVAIVLTKADYRLIEGEEELARLGDEANPAIRDRVADARREIAACEPPPLDVATAQVEEELRAQDDRYARQQANWEQVKALPQLFIAT